MLKARTPLLVGLLVIAAVGAFVFTFGSLDRGMSEKDAYTVYARFDDATGLAPGSRIMIAGIEVGRLGKPVLDPEDPAKARVPLLIKKEIILKKGIWDAEKRTWVNGAAAVRRQASLIGDYDVVLSTGLDGEVIPPGGLIPNIVNETGISAVIKKLEDSSRAIFPQLEKITTDISTITGSLREAIGDEKGSAALTKIRDDVEKTTDNVQKLTSEMRAFLNEKIFPRSENLERIMGHLERASSQLADASGSSLERIDKILARIETVSGDISRFVKDQTAPADQAKDGTVSKVLAGVDKNLALIEGSLENVRKITSDVEQGRGTIGRLLTDDKLINDVERVIGDVQDFTSTFTRTQVKVQFRTDYFVGRSAYKSTIDFQLQPSPDKYYLFQLVDDPLGKTERKLRVTASNDPDVPPILVEDIAETTGDFKITAQFAKRFHFLTFRYGLMESTGGIGVDADLLNDSLNFKVDAFDFGRTDRPRFRLLAQWEFLNHFFIGFGIDDILNDASRDWFVGLGLRFTDDTLKSVLPFVPKP
ncbi:MAG: MCE family protein [Deltaproteobacteria bacterium]|nr:MCE family protein [Deltaproteobacteria bacterium]